MNKIGASHIDWAVSMGIFLVYILLMIVFLKPGITPIYEPESLMILIEDQFFDDTQWVVKETQLGIRKCGPIVPPTEGRECNIHININNEWEFKKVNEVEDFEPRILNTDDIIGIKGGIICGIQSNLFIDKTMKLIYYPSDPHDQKNPENMWIDVTSENNPPTACEASGLGGTIEYEGLNKNLVNDLVSKTYVDLKSDWDFPENKDFKIEVISEAGNADNIGSKSEPAAEINVFVKEISTVYLNQDSTREPVVIRIGIW